MVQDLEISDERLDIAVRAAEEAGSAAASVKHTTTQERKGNDTIVTEADKEAEHIVRDILTAETEYPILGEEQGGNVETEDTYWVVDPIDGTHNFSYQQPLYGSAVALVESGEPTVGVFYMPDLDYLFYAVEGEGAYRNAEQLTVSEATEPDEAFYLLSGKGRTDILPGVAELNEWNQQLGSAVMAEGWIASGWNDVGVFGALAPWDMAVGVILVREAGGVLKHIQSYNSDWEHIQNGRVVFGNEKTVDKVLDALSEGTVTTTLESTYEY